MLTFQAVSFFVLLPGFLRFPYMDLKIFTIVSLFAVSAAANCQADAGLNQTDQQGRKQGHWISKYPNGNTRYEGYFRDNIPVGEFKRYYDDKSLNSVLIYSTDGKTIDATIYYPNGYICAQGKYVDQLKEGKWRFYSSSVDGYLINEEDYSKNLRNGLSLKFFTDSTIAEKVRYVNDKREGECLQNYLGGRIFIRSNYSCGLLNGKFEVWFENGKTEFSGFYKNNLREGKWYIYNEDGSLRYELNYTGGVTKDRQMDIDASEIIDNLEKNKGKIADPEKTGEIR
jgi:antitoxin component YwqK of YwqJK toxin-antitoxin module